MEKEVNISDKAWNYVKRGIMQNLTEGYTKAYYKEQGFLVIKVSNFWHKDKKISSKSLAYLAFFGNQNNHINKQLNIIKNICVGEEFGKVGLPDFITIPMQKCTYSLPFFLETKSKEGELLEEQFNMAKKIYEKTKIMTYSAYFPEELKIQKPELCLFKNLTFINDYDAYKKNFKEYKERQRIKDNSEKSKQTHKGLLDF